MQKNYDLIIIGGGPAGLTAGIYARRYGLTCLIVEKYFFGGQMNLTTEIKNFPSYEDITGQELSEKMKQHYLSYNSDILQANVETIDFKNKTICTKKGNFGYTSLVIATGATARKLNLKNETELTGHGISYCAICDGFFFKNKEVIVVGSGSAAMEDAIYLADLCKKVTIISKHKNFTGQDIFLQQLKSKNNIEYYMNYATTQIFGDTEFKGIEIEERDSHEKHNICADGMFIQVGRVPDTDFLKGNITLNPIGFIKCDEHLQTNIEGVFVAGDVRETPLRQIITACSDGAIVANNAFKYIEDIKRK